MESVPVYVGSPSRLIDESCSVYFGNTDEDIILDSIRKDDYMQIKVYYYF